MPSVTPATISLLPTSQAAETSKGAVCLPVLSRGEVLTAEVARKLDGGRFLLTLKNALVSADSEVPLKPGQKLLVRVEQVQPRILLSVAANDAPETAMINGYLKLHRAAPDSLAALMREAGIFLNSKNLGELTRYLSAKNVEGILSLIQKMILSPENLKDPLFLKQFVSGLGLLWESDLRKLLQDSSGDTGTKEQRNTIKGLLMELSADLASIPGEEVPLNSKTGRALSRLADFVDRSIKSIEAQQVINVLAQEKGSPYILQIPLPPSEGPGTGDIFIEFDEKASGKEGGSRYAVVIFLSLDAVGDLMIETRVTGQTIGCLIKCESREVCDFISSSAGELGRRLASLGYTIDRLSCLVGEDMQRMKYEYVKDHAVYGRDVVDYFV